MGELANTVKGALKALQQLQIVTAVGKVTVSEAFTRSPQIELAAEQKAMVTRIDLVQGDIINALDNEFAPGQNDPLREFHERQVKLGNDIIARNINLLKTMAKEIIEIAKIDGSCTCISKGRQSNCGQAYPTPQPEHFFDNHSNTPVPFTKQRLSPFYNNLACSAPASTHKKMGHGRPDIG